MKELFQSRSFPWKDGQILQLICRAYIVKLQESYTEEVLIWISTPQRFSQVTILKFSCPLSSLLQASIAGHMWFYIKYLFSNLLWSLSERKKRFFCFCFVLLLFVCFVVFSSSSSFSSSFLKIVLFKPCKSPPIHFVTLCFHVKTVSFMPPFIDQEDYSGKPLLCRKGHINA